jgi:hypothetical protein
MAWHAVPRWAKAARLARDGRVKIAHRGGQNHQPSKEDIARRFCDAFDEPSRKNETCDPCSWWLAFLRSAAAPTPPRQPELSRVRVLGEQSVRFGVVEGCARCGSIAPTGVGAAGGATLGAIAGSTVGGGAGYRGRHRRCHSRRHHRPNIEHSANEPSASSSPCCSTPAIKLRSCRRPVNHSAGDRVRILSGHQTRE